jgi:hypothetical protein
MPNYPSIQEYEQAKTQQSEALASLPELQDRVDVLLAKHQALCKKHGHSGGVLQALTDAERARDEARRIAGLQPI